VIVVLVALFLCELSLCSLSLAPAVVCVWLRHCSVTPIYIATSILYLLETSRNV
jgi:hypothetical protein